MNKVWEIGNKIEKRGYEKLLKYTAVSYLGCGHGKSSCIVYLCTQDECNNIVLPLGNYTHTL